MGWFGPSGDCGCCDDPCEICSCDTFPAFEFTFDGFEVSCCDGLNIGYQYDCDVDGLTAGDSPVNHPGENGSWYLADTFITECGFSGAYVAEVWVKVGFVDCVATINIVHQQENQYREFSITIDCSDPDADPVITTVASSAGQAPCDYLYALNGGVRVSFAWV